MEGLGIAASVISVIELSTKVAGLCLQYSIAVKNAKADIERLRNVLNAFKNTLEDAQQLLKDSNSAKLPSSRKVSGLLVDCSLQLVELEKKLDLGKTHKLMKKVGFRALKWPFTSKEVEGIVKNLEQYQNIFSLSLNIDQTTQILGIGQKIDLSRLLIAKDASFDSHADEHEARCHPDTRVDLLRDITRWVENSQGESVFWLNGMAGTGKSTISRTVAKSFADRKELGASFFFKRGERDRGNAALFFPTIAAQLISKEPALAPYVRNAIDTDPAICGKAMKEQFEKLILLPLGNVYRDVDHPVRIVIVVDALDECDRDNDIRVIIYQLAQAKALPSVQLRMLVTSRPELPIRLGFKNIQGKYEDLVLHEIPEPIIEHDISAFLEHRMAIIKDEYNALVPAESQLPSCWPGQKNIQTLVHIAAPLFIFAATVCRFIEDQAWADPEAQLIKVLEYQSRTQDSDLDKLDATYLPILNNLIHGRSDSEKDHLVEEFRDVIGSIVLLAEPLSTSSLARLLDITRPAIDRRLSSLHSILRVPSSTESPVRIFHLSFRDFLIDPARRTLNPFHIDARRTHERIASRCIQFMDSSGCLKKDICNLKMPGTPRANWNTQIVDKFMPPDIRYACLYWVHHFEQSKCQIVDGDQVHLFLTHHFLHWIEALTIIGKLSESIGMMKTLQRCLQPAASSEVSAFLYDAELFILNCRTPAEVAPLQIYSSAIIFAPKSSIVRNVFKDQIPEWILVPPNVGSEWDACLQTLEGHSGRVTSAAFSHNGEYLASASHDHTVKIWDANTGACLQTLEAHNDKVNCVAFCHTSGFLASASSDCTIKIWDPSTGACLQTLQGHDDEVLFVTFSPSTLASTSDDQTIKIWDFRTGACMQTLKGHRGEVNSVSFSHSCKLLASGAEDYLIKIWDLDLNTCIQTLDGHSSAVKSVAFYNNSDRLASASSDSTIRIWDIGIGSCLQTFEDHMYGINSIAFSQNCKFLASAGRDRTIRFRDASSGACLQRLSGHSDVVNSIAFSRNSKRMVSVSHDCTIKIWDTNRIPSPQEGHGQEVTCIAISYIGDQIASSTNFAIKIWDTSTGECITTIKNDKFRIQSVAFSRNGNLASGLCDGTLHLWNPLTGSCLWTIEGGNHSCDPCVVFSNSGKQLASVSFEWNIMIWDTDTSTCLQTLTGHKRGITSMAFSHNDEQVASAGYDHTINIWDVSTGTCLQTIEQSTMASFLSNTPSFESKVLFSYCLPENNSWISRKGDNILWIPPDYRSDKATVKGQLIVFVHSDRIIFMKFKEVVDLIDC